MYIIIQIIKTMNLKFVTKILFVICFFVLEIGEGKIDLVAAMAEKTKKNTIFQIFNSISENEIGVENLHLIYLFMERCWGANFCFFIKLEFWFSPEFKLL